MGHSHVVCGKHSKRLHDLLLTEAAILLVRAIAARAASNACEPLWAHASSVWRGVIRQGWPGGHEMGYEALFVNADSLDEGIAIHDEALNLAKGFGHEIPADWMESVRREVGLERRMFLAPVSVSEVVGALAQLRSLLVEARSDLRGD